MFVFVIILIIILIVAQIKSKKMGLQGITYDYRLSKSAIEIHEEVELISTITNETRRFMPFIRMVEALPIGARAADRTIQIRENELGLGGWFYNSSIYLTARSRLKRRLKLTFDKRGWYVFNGSTLHGGDYLGLSTTSERFPLSRTITVYPAPIRSLQLQQMLGGFLGDISVQRFIMEDPVLTIGTREYTGREPMKQMSWKHTARTSQMMVKQFDYTTEMVVTIVLDVEQPKGKMFSDAQFEACFSLARTVAQHLEQAKIPFDFTTNALIAGLSKIEQESKSVSQSLGPAHLRFVLEKLGRASYGAKESFADLLDTLRLAQKQRYNHSIIMITPDRDSDKEKLLKRLELDVNGSVLTLYGEDFAATQSSNGGASA